LFYVFNWVLNVATDEVLRSVRGSTLVEEH